MFQLARERPSKAAHLAGLTLLDQFAPRSLLAVTRMMSVQPAFDVTHCQFGYVGLTAMRHRSYGTLRSRVLAVHLRGSDITRFVCERGGHVYNELFRKAELFIANCHHFRDRAERLGCPPEKLTVIGSPIDTDRFAPPAVRPPHGNRPVRLVAVGRLVEKKGFADAIDAVARLRDTGPDLRLDVHGGGELLGTLEAQIARAGLGDRVALHGVATRNQVIGALHRADIALAPSVRTSTGDEDAPVNTLKEAMATGLPVIATDHGGIPELVKPGENGDLVPERDPEALAASIAAMATRPEDWRRLGDAGRRKVIAEYDRAAVAEKTLAAYRDALSETGESS